MTENRNLNLIELRVTEKNTLEVESGKAIIDKYRVRRRKSTLGREEQNDNCNV